MRKAFAAAALAAIVSGPAWAKTYSIEFTAVLEDEYIDSVYIMTTDGFELIPGDVAPEVIGSVGFFREAGLDTEFRGRVKFETDPDGYVLDLHSCKFGVVDCFPPDGLGFGWGDFRPETGGLDLADVSTNETYEIGPHGISYFSDTNLPKIDERYFQYGISAYSAKFDVIDYKMAAVPLPAALPLLPVALGGLFVIGRRRRS